MKSVLITGAAGNLGGLLAEHLKTTEINLNLLIHNKDVIKDLKNRNNIKIFKADLSKKETFDSALKNIDVIVHFAGVLFKNNPEKFLPVTNTIYFRNLLEKAIEHKVNRIILISFPHVEAKRLSKIHQQINLMENNIRSCTNPTRRRKIAFCRK